MLSAKSKYFNIYALPIKLLALVICSFLFASCNTNETQQILTVGNKAETVENAVNINTASVAELEKLPNVGVKLAQRIVEYRENFGKFRKSAHLILVPGISDERFRQLQNLVKTE